MEAHPAASPPAQALLWPVPKTVAAAAAQARGKTRRKRTGVAVNPKRKRRYRLNKSLRAHTQASFACDYHAISISIMQIYPVG